MAWQPKPAGPRTTRELFHWLWRQFTDVGKLIEDASLSDAEVKAAYENNADTNAFTDAEQSKLSGIEAGATADKSAAEVPVADSGGNFTATDVEGVLAELHATATADVAKTYVATVNYNDSSPVTLVSNLPAGSDILEVKAFVKTAFNGTTPTIKIGSSGTDDSVIDTTEVDLTDASAGGNPTILGKWVEWSGTENLICTIGGSGASQGQVKLAITVA